MLRLRPATSPGILIGMARALPFPLSMGPALKNWFMPSWRIWTIQSDWTSLLKMNSLLIDAQTLVVKVGSSLLTDNGRGLDQAAISAWVDQIAELVKRD